MIPIGDYLRTRSPAYVNWLLIGVNVAVFVYTLTLSRTPDLLLAGAPTSAADRLLIDWGFIPACLGHQFGAHPQVSARVLNQICPTSQGELLRPFSAMFLHAGWLHIAGNMLFLWIFGDNVEDAMGHLRYLLFYFLCGIGAAAAQAALTIDSTVPAIGASGAIAGVLAAYLFLYPRAIVEVIILPLFFIPFFIPAVALIALWFAIQLLNGLTSVGNSTAGSGVAYWAHVGGFAAGAVLVWPFRRKERSRVFRQWGRRVSSP